MRFAFAALLIAAGLAGLVTAGIVYGGVPELQVRELVADPPREGRVVKVHGILHEVRSEGRPLRFVVRDKADASRTMDVVSDRSRPDTFQPTYDIAVVGTYDTGRGLFVADQIFTKCPSKYEGEAKAGMGAPGAKPDPNAPSPVPDAASEPKPAPAPAPAPSTAP